MRAAPRAPMTPAAGRAHAPAGYANLPLGFERNAGQAAPGFDFLSRGGGYRLYLASTQTALVVGPEPGSRDARVCPDRSVVVRLHLIGGNPGAHGVGAEATPGTVSYFVGTDPAKWRTRIPTFAKVRYEGVYPGVDLVYYGTGRLLEYDFVVAPGADPGAIRLAVEGGSPRTSADGDLVLDTAAGSVRLRQPSIHQKLDDGRHTIPGGYEVADANQIRFRVGPYRTDRPLVIDPVLTYSAALGGSDDERAFALALDAEGNVHVAGHTRSLDFPAPDARTGGDFDVVVATLDPTGSTLLSATYFGGAGLDEALGLAVDAAGNTWVAGRTDSPDFPTTAAAIQGARAGGFDAFVAKLDASGSRLVYATYLGGGGDDGAAGIALDAAGSAYVTGDTGSSDFPTADASLPYRGGTDAFVSRLDPSGARLVFSTYLGGRSDDAGRAITLDGAGAAVVTGETRSPDFPTRGGLQAENHGGSDAFVTRLGPADGTIQYSTYLGGSGDDTGRAVAVDASGTVHVTGGTSSLDFPVLAAVQPQSGGGLDAFVVGIDAGGAEGRALTYATYVGGAGDEMGRAIALGASGDVFVTGDTSSADFPATNALQVGNAGGLDAFLVRLSAGGSRVGFSTSLGGAGDDVGHGLAVTAAGVAYVAGETSSLDGRTGVDILVARVDNQPPVATDDVGVTTGNGPVRVDVVANDTDPDGNLDPRSVRIVEGPRAGSASVEPTTGAVVYTPHRARDSADSLTYAVCDTDGACATARLVVTVGGGSGAGATGQSTASATAPIVIAPASITTISGTVFEDVNYGGGAGRSRAASSGVVRSGVRVELYGPTGSFVGSTATNASGVFSFVNQQDNRDYTLRVASGTVTSSRAGAVASLVAVQTFRTNASSGSVVADPNRVGGEDPSKVDAGSNGTNVNLSTLTTSSTTAQSITPVHVGAGVSSVTGLDFGFNFDTIVSTRNSGQGTLRQFITNSSTLGGDASLAQSGSRKDANNANVALPAARESSIFMIPDGLAHPGLRAGLVNQLSGSGVAVITLTSALPPLTGANAPNTIIDGTTQTVNVGDTNSGQLGTGGTVGVGADGVAGTGDELTLSRVYRPEVQLVNGAGLALGLDVTEDDVAIRGLSIYGFGTSASDNAHANIRIGKATRMTGALIEQNVIGASAISFTDPGAGARTGGANIRSPFGKDSGMVRNNLIGFSQGKGFALEGGSTSWTIENNEIRGNAINNQDLAGIDLENGSGGTANGNGATATVRGNLIVGTKGIGIDSFNGAGGNTIVNNTITGNGVGPDGSSPAATPGIRLYGPGNVVDRNLIFDNFGAGVMVTTGSTGNRFTRNSIYDNGAILNEASAGPTNQIGIDLLKAGDDAAKGTSPFVTINDSGDGDSGGNGLLNFPILGTAGRTGAFLILTGFARPGSVIELFVADVATGSSPPAGFGEGRTYLTTLTEGSAADTDGTTGTYGPGAINGLSQGTDTTNRFRFEVALPAGVTIGTVLTATATVSGATSEFSGNVTVADANSAPVAVNYSYSTPEDTPRTVSAPGVLGNDTDADGDPLAVALVAGPSNGTVSLNANGSFTYTPNANFNGTDSFTYRANDGLANSNTATVTLTVTPVNDPPNAVNDTATVAEDSGVNTISVLANDNIGQDLGEVLTVIAVTQGAHGTVAITGGGAAVTYTPSANFNGSDSFSYTISDGNGGTDSATVSVTVTAVNDPPNAVDDAVAVVEDSGANTIDVRANDTAAPDVGETLTVIAVTQGAHGTVAITGGGTALTYTPSPNYTGSDSFTYTLSDGNGGTDTATVAVTVTNVNDAPNAADDAATVVEDSGPNAINVLANDTNPDPNETLSVSAVSQGANGTVVITGGGTGVTYAPDANFAGVDSFTYTLSDGNGGFDTATVTVTVTNVNDPPTAVDDAATVTEDSDPNALNVLANDTSAPDAGETLSITAVTQGSNGTVAITGGGTGVTYAPDPDFFGTDSFTYTISDGNGGTDSATVTLTVTNVNDPPTVNADVVTVVEDSGANAISVLDNDSSAPDTGETLTIIGVTQGAHGTVSIAGGGTALIYTPDPDFAGTDSFTYQVGDGNGGTSTATVTVTVTNVNDPPTVLDDVATLPEDNGPTAIDVLANDSCAPDTGETLTITAVSQGASGTVTITGGGTGLTYTPNHNFAGTDSFSYTVSDGNGGTSIATVTVNVTQVNDAPVGLADAYSMQEDTPLTVAAPGVLANDTDVEGDALTTVLVAGPSHGTLTLNADGSFTYTPDLNFNGEDSFSYQARDGVADSGPVTVGLAIGPVNDAPVAQPDRFSTPEDTPRTVPAPGVLVNDVDVENDALTAILVSGPVNGTLLLNADGSYTYTPNLNYNGPDSFTYQATDGIDIGNVTTVTISVGPLNDAPVAVADDYAMLEDSSLHGDAPGVLGNDTDVEMNALSALLVKSPRNGLVTMNADGSFDYVPNPDFFGTDSFTYQVSDGVDDGNVATVTISVANVNDPPRAVDDAVAVAEDSGANLIPVLANDTSAPDAGEILSVIAVTQGSMGTVAITADGGSVVYTPNANANGIDTFTYTISDGNGGTDGATVTVTIASVNDPPSAVDDIASVPEDGGVTIDVLANDSDVDGDQVVLTIAVPPFNGTATVDDRGTPGDPSDDVVIYTPAHDFNGVDSFVYQIDDGHGGISTAAVMVQVLPLNDAPVAVILDAAQQLAGSVGVPLELDGSPSFDVDGTVVTYRWDFGDGSAVDTTSGSHATHVYSTPGTYTVQLVVVDDQGAASAVAATREVVLGSDFDRALYVRAGGFRVNWSRHARGVRADAFRIRGNINPRHLHTDLSGATLTLRVNGALLADTVPLDATGAYSSPAGVSPRVRCRLRSTNGAYRCSMRRADLRALVGLPDATARGLTVLEVTLEVDAGGLPSPVITGRYEFAYASRQNRATRGTFRYRKNRTLTGVYLSLRTRVRQLRKGGQRLTASGPLLRVGAGPLVPTGGIRLKAGDAVVSIPFTALTWYGPTDARSRWVYSSRFGAVLGLSRFVLDNRAGKFQLALRDPSGIGVALAGSGAPMVADLPVAIEVTTPQGVMATPYTVVELKRPAATSRRWKR